MPHATIRSSIDNRLAAGLFAVLILAAALLYGAVDRVVQIGLVLGLGIGFLIHPPEVPRLPRAWAWAVLAIIGFVAVSQFLPFRWFGDTVWHRVLTRDYGVVFPFTRNPEPGRALDCLLVGVLATGWFFWVRTLANDRSTRMFLVWALFVAAATVAVVSLALGTRSDSLIYGVRYTPGWTGFGPFPNRNHTAALLAMGALAGAGCIVRAGRRRYWAQLAPAIPAEVAIVVALLESKSRGGLLGLGCGLVAFAVLAISKHRSRSAVAGALAGGLLCATLVLSFGSSVLSRFDTQGDGNIPNSIRWEIWQDAIRVWRDAPLWGHGLGTFAQVFPFYQTVEAHEQVILHPESSWLLWLDELGAVPVGIGALLLLYFIGRNAVSAVQTGDRGFFLRAGAFAGVAGLLCHGLWDVPVHRWGTAAYGLALLAIACPPLHRRQQFRLGRLWAGVPGFIGLFWLLPFFGEPLYWTPDAARQLVMRLATAPTAASLDELKQMERVFPLNAGLHEHIGIRETVISRRPDEGWREFRIADRLSPASWTLPAMQAWLSRDYSPGMSFYFWSVAVERAGRRDADIFQAAYQDSVDLQGGEQYWWNYAQNHPEFLLRYAEASTNLDHGKAAYGMWWKERGQSSASIDSWEPLSFYSVVRKWGSPAQLEDWMAHHPGLAVSDFRIWAAILHQWQKDSDAWQILSSHIANPPYPEADGTDSLDALEEKWRSHPEDPMVAQAYARQCSFHGDNSRAEEVIFSVASGQNPPPWFIEKAAYLYAAKKDYSTAVASLLRIVPTKS